MEGIEQISYIKSLCEIPSSRSSDDSLVAKRELKVLKANFVSKNDQISAKEIWILETIIEVQAEYVEAFNLLKAKRFYDGWCQLEKCEISCEALFSHFRTAEDQYKVKWIARIVEQYQQLFPYKYFMSTELIEIEKRCSICNSIVTIRRQCGHKVGEIYNGEYCLRIVTKLDMPGMALVEEPVHKYAVPFFVDPETKQQKDNYDYRNVEYIIDKLDNPYSGWRFEKLNVKMPHNQFKSYGRNDKCPCGSGEKYKKCCLGKEGVDGVHTQFYLEREPITKIPD